MKRMIIFLLVALSIYGAANLYIFARSAQALTSLTAFRWIFFFVFAFLVFSYPLGRILFVHIRNGFSAFLMRVGALYIALMLMLLMWALAVDLIRLANRLVNFLPAGLALDGGRMKLVLFLVAYGSSLAVLAAGAWNAARPKITSLDIRLDKSCPGRQELRIAAASDIHLGVTAGAGRLEKIVSKINALSPDIVFLPGDIFDESMMAGEEGKLEAAFARLRAPLGVFAVVGNHEAYSGLERNIDCLTGFGIRVLQDEALMIDNSFYVVGRNDPNVRRSGKVRLPLREILEKNGINRKFPVILLDHQPIRLEEAAREGVDLQLSGHTHAGQLFPLNLINKLVYEKNWGYLQKDKTHFYVSSGAGTWGPPVRTGSRSEIVLVRLLFETGGGSDR